MSNSIYKTPTPINEVVRSYAPGTSDRQLIKAALAEAKSQAYDIPMIINGKEVRTDNLVDFHPPHENKDVFFHSS